MLKKFYKYQGTGNDFVIFDNRDNSMPKLSQDKVAHLCHRRFGIGADGLMLLEKVEGFDFKMVYYNSDGKESTMCGNGGRCLVMFAHDLGVIQDKAYFLAVDGPHLAYVQANEVHLGMIDVYDIEQNESALFMNTGSPHYVEFRKEVAQLDVFSMGKKIRYDDKFAPGGTNVNFAELLPQNTLLVRTYERGVEDETYSCGTGVTACAIAAYFEGYQSPVNIRTKGGDLKVSFEPKAAAIFENVFLIGPAEKVFQGEVNL
jgi:diaminopimelate epimerase